MGDALEQSLNAREGVADDLRRVEVASIDAVMGQGRVPGVRAWLDGR